MFHCKTPNRNVIPGRGSLRRSAHRKNIQALIDLVHSLAKEERRLYNLHGRNSRYTQICKDYLAYNGYFENLNRQLHSKHFSSFIKALNAIQENALIDAILAVLLKYSNSSKEAFLVNRLKTKYEFLNQGFS